MSRADLWRGFPDHHGEILAGLAEACQRTDKPVTASDPMIHRAAARECRVTDEKPCRIVGELLENPPQV